MLLVNWNALAPAPYSVTANGSVGLVLCKVSRNEPLFVRPLTYQPPYKCSASKSVTLSMLFEAGFDDPSSVSAMV